MSKSRSKIDKKKGVQQRLKNKLFKVRNFFCKRTEIKSKQVLLRRKRTQKFRKKNWNA